MKHIKKFEKFNKVNEHGYIEDLEGLRDDIAAGKKILIVNTLMSPTSDVATVSIGEVLEMSKGFDVVTMGASWGNDQTILSRCSQVTLDYGDDSQAVRNLPNFKAMEEVGYDL